MSNEVTTGRNSALAALKSLKTGLANMRQRLPENSGSPFFKMATDGEFMFGQDENIVKLGTEAAVGTLSIREGYVCWTVRDESEKKQHGKNELMGEEMYALGQPVPAAHELPQHRDTKTDKLAPWKQQFSLDLKFMDGKHKGVQVKYQTSSVGGLQAVRLLLDAILKRVNDDNEFFFPIVTINSDWYKNKNHGGKTYFPIFDVVGWLDVNGDEEGADEDQPKLAPAKAEPEPEPAPTRRTARAAAPEVADEAPAEVEDEPAAEDEAPPARRRRRA